MLDKIKVYIKNKQMNIAIVKTKMEKHVFKCLNCFFVTYERPKPNIISVYRIKQITSKVKKCNIFLTQKKYKNNIIHRL